ncbi:hypothetical protein H072_6802 [Dactylellina haptotyla CBS 200.50]|uniref:Uncharacterized protein n=1 Tax=Dactylellina haptotyla (strain CBS 200.50) TaxID=1284197 RepID=S8AE76_DACHA|nr:hypothetical protein H072_6802 [Dactylellina haptotyla CBS 200.50]
MVIRSQQKKVQVFRRADMLRELFGGEESPDLPTPGDRWKNIKYVVRKTFKEVGYKNGCLYKRWTELTPRFKNDLMNTVLSEVSEYDRRVLIYRPDVLEKLLKEHILSREDWRKEKLKKVKQQKSATQTFNIPTPKDERLKETSYFPYKLESNLKEAALSVTTPVPPLSSLVAGLERIHTTQTIRCQCPSFLPTHIHSREYLRSLH